MNFTKQVNNANIFYNKITELYSKLPLCDEQKIKFLSHISEYAWNWHTGRFTSRFIENECIKIATSFAQPNSPSGIEESEFVVFAATELYETGGHTRLLENYAEYLSKKKFIIKLIITRQNHNQVPQRIKGSKLFRDIICLLDNNCTEGINTIREISSCASYIFNFQHPDDTLLITALNYSNRPYTYYVNHADHVFWLGISASDAILNLRPYSQSLTETRRNAKLTKHILPVRLNLERKYPEKAASRIALGLDPDAVVFVIVSALWKIFPDLNYNIYEIIAEILKLDKRIVVLMVGSTSEDYKNFSGNDKPERVKCYGVQSDTAIYLAAADYYLEGMPSSSLTALMEGIAAGIYPFLIWGPYHPNMRNDNEFYIQGVVTHPFSKDRYLDRICRIVQNPPVEELRAAIKEMKSNMIYFSSDEYWDGIFNFGIWKNRADGYLPLEPEFQNLLYDQRVAEQASLLYGMNRINPYYSIISKLYSSGLINGYQAWRIWILFGLKFSGVSRLSIKSSYSLFLTLLPKPKTYIKRLYFNLGDENIIKSTYRKFKENLIKNK